MKFVDIDNIEIIKYDNPNTVYDIELEKNHYFATNTIISHNCRLRSDLSKVKEYSNSFGVGISIGSHRVVTLNLPRIAFESEDNDTFIKNLEHNTKMAQDILSIHRQIIVDNINKGKLPLYTHQFMFLNRQFSTIGFIGLNEACEVMDSDIISKAGLGFAKIILSKIAELNEQKAKADGNMWNIEQIPGESAAYELAQKDKKLFTNHKYTMYGNQYIPLWKNTDIEERIKVQGELDSYTSGGGILHLNCTDSLDPEQIKQLIEYAAKKGVIYFAVNMNIVKCTNCGKLYVGKFDKSPCHNAPVINYTRVVGFFVPVQQWSRPRREEYKIRQFYKTSDVNNYVNN